MMTYVLVDSLFFAAKKLMSEWFKFSKFCFFYEEINITINYNKLAVNILTSVVEYNFCLLEASGSAGDIFVPHD